MYCVKTYSQQSLDIYGNAVANGFRLNSFESNPGNYSPTKDWEFSIVFGGASGGLGSEFSGDVYLASIAKKIGSHYFYGRYTPGFTKEFIFNSGSSISSDSSLNILSTSVSYEERFGFGYSYDLTDNISVGLSLRFFEQNLSADQVNLSITDTLNSLFTTTNNFTKKYWRSDVGVNYMFSDDLSISLSSINLVILNENGSFETDEALEMKVDKGIALMTGYNAMENLKLHAEYETQGSFGLGFNYSFNLLGGKFGAGVSTYHDRNQNPYLCCVVPALNYSSELFNVSLVGVKYLTDRTNAKPLSGLTGNGISNIFNNPFSTDKLLVTVNFALSFKPEQMVKFESLEIHEEIFPALKEIYLDTPIASARVINISDKTVSVKPASYIEELNEDLIYSQPANIDPRDTVIVNFYTIIKPDVRISKRLVTNAEFYLSTVNTDYDDVIKKPILINDQNSWNGKVSTLRFFAKSDYQFATEYAKDVFNKNKSLFDTTVTTLSTFTKIKILFDHFVSRMVYVSDPRSSVEYVQFPNETIERRGGDCDDLSVGFSALLESVGVQTAFVDYKSEDGVSHVNLLINTELLPEQASLITNNDKKYFVRENQRGTDQVWIPVEMTSLTNFEAAWNIGSEKFQKEALDDLGLVKGSVEIIDVY